MGTTVQKLQRILETKTGFKDLITEKGGVITETTTFHEYIDEARKLMEGGKVVVEEASATAVPNEGFVEKIYFNTNLTPEEVDQIITEANLEWQTDPSSGLLVYGVYYADSGDSLIIMKFGEENPKYIMMGALPSVGVTVFMPYLSIGAASLLGMTIPSGSEEGWIYDSGVGISSEGIVPIKGNLMSEYNGMAAGIDNEALKKLISSTPFSAGKQPVPNSDYVESIKFNTSLSCEEVEALLDKLEYKMGDSMPLYIILEDSLSNISIMAMKAEESGMVAYAILALLQEPSAYYAIYQSKSLEGALGPGYGWVNQPHYETYPQFKPENFIINSEVKSSIDGWGDIGYLNSLITDLVYIESESFRKELSGTYEAVTTDITENGEVDLTTYWDNSEMPIKVNVNIEAGASGEAIEVATEEELDAAMVEENLGKFYKFTGETTNKYEKDAVYVVQDADNPIIEDEIKSITTEVGMDAALVEENIGKFFLYAGETCDKYANNMIYTVQDKDNPIIDGPAIIEGGATGTAVPNEGYVEEIYFNNSLSVEEVDNIINNANLEWVESEGMKVYGLVYVPDWINGDGVKCPLSLMIMNLAYILNSDKPVYILWISEGFDDGPIYASEPVEMFKAKFKGWGIFESEDPDNCNIYHPNPLEINLDVAKTNPNIPDSNIIGAQNEALKQLISITPFDGEPFYKELKGTYEPITVEVTENGETDLTSYWDNQQMPIKINVDIESESEPVVVKAEETRSAVPNSGYLDTVYFNTDLTVAEIDELIANADVPWNYNGVGEVIFVTEDLSLNIILLKGEAYGLTGYMIVNMKTMEFLYVSQDLYNIAPGDVPFVGWNPVYVNSYMVKANVLSELTNGSESLKIGENNEAIKDIMYVKSGFNYDKQLAGNYEAININITNNQKIELDSYFDNKQVPVKLNVNVASSGSLKALLDYTKSTSYLFSNWTDVTEYTNDHIAFDATSNVEDMSYMFKQCEKLVSVPLFDTSNAINLERIFWGCLSLAEIPEFNLSNAANLEYAFYNCTSLKSIPEFNTSNATSLQGMFQKCTALKEATLLHLEKATNISYLFRYCDNLEKVVLGDLSPMMEAEDIFTGCYNLTNLTIGSIWASIYLVHCDKLTLDSLIGICKACVCRNDNNKLKINTTSLEKLANVYVKFTDSSITEIPNGEKGDVVVCDSTDEGAMLITDYIALKNWTISTN